MTSQTEAAFLLKRAEEEAIQAIRADQPEAAAVHDELSRRYSERAQEALNGASARGAASRHER